MNGDKVKHVQTSTHAPTTEGFIRTFRMHLFRRLDALKQDRSQRVDHVDTIFEHFNYI